MYINYSRQCYIFFACCDVHYN